MKMNYKASIFGSHLPNKEFIVDECMKSSDIILEPKDRDNILIQQHDGIQNFQMFQSMKLKCIKIENIDELNADGSLEQKIIYNTTEIEGDIDNSDIVRSCDYKNLCVKQSGGISNIKVEKTNEFDETEDAMVCVNNIKQNEVKTKEENSNFDSENNYNQSLNIEQCNINTIEFVNVKVEQEDDFDTEESALDNIIDLITTKDGFFQCNYCKRTFTTAEYCHIHIRRCRIRVYDQPSTTSDNISEVTALVKKPRQAKDEEGLHQCDQCDCHYVSRKHTCKECGKQFIRPSALSAHLILIHAKEKLKCTQCEATFTREAMLRTHMLTYHGARPHICTQCGKSFRVTGSLTRHMITHTGEKPYHCTQCTKSFIKGSDLTRHVRTHTGEKPYQCTICNSTFAEKGSLRRHMNTHSKA